MKETPKPSNSLYAEEKDLEAAHKKLRREIALAQIMRTHGKPGVAIWMPQT